MSQSLFFPWLISTMEAEGAEGLKHLWQWDAESWGIICKKHTRSLLGAPHRALTNAWTLCVAYPRAIGTATTFNRRRENRRNPSLVNFALPKNRSNYVFGGFGLIRQLILFKARTPLTMMFTQVPSLYWSLLGTFTAIAQQENLNWVELYHTLHTQDLSLLFFIWRFLWQTTLITIRMHVNFPWVRYLQPKMWILKSRKILIWFCGQFAYLFT